MWGYIFGAIGVLGVLIGVVGVVRSRKERRPCWAFETHSVIGKGAELEGDVQILFQEHPVSQVSVTRVVLWNRGRQSIRKTDLVGEVTAGFPQGVEILREPRVVKSSREEIGFLAKRKDRCVTLTFEFLDHEDGAMVEVVHTGDTATKPQLSATIIEVPSGVKFMGSVPLPFPEAIAAKFGTTMPGPSVPRATLGEALVGVAVTVALGTLFGIPLGLFRQHFGSWWYILISAFGGLLFLVFFMVTIVLFLEILRSKLPSWFYSETS